MSPRSALVLALCLAVVSADVYMHNPRGSNDRNCEKNENRNNGNRLFDSQNNAKGGYACPRAPFSTDPAKQTPRFYYYTGSELQLEWTNQHGCGVNNKSECTLILQYGCEDTMPDIRDGAPQNANDAATNRVPDSATDSKLPEYGVHESYEYYQSCKARSRNKGLYISDRAINGNNIGSRAINTRQNPNGNRNGFECPEERDYYPYWHPTPWKDIAILTDTTSRCAMYQAQSENVKARGYCVAAGDTCTSGLTCLQKLQNQEASCKAEGGEWRTQAAHGIAPPECLEAVWNRDNSLGNGFGSLFGGTNSYVWKIPNTPRKSCVLRLRYNISTSDVPSFNTDATSNGDRAFPQTDPYIDLGGSTPKMILSTNVNTNQFGRTFQDRSYVFEIKKRTIDANTRIQNLNVRGKRGNIVQTYPAVEYDFTPQVLATEVGAMVHIQWVGSDYNAPRNPNDGEGQQNSDRHNIVQLAEAGDNVPPLVGGKPKPTPDGREDANKRKVYTLDTSKQTMFGGDAATINKFAFLNQDVATCKKVADLNNDATRDDPTNCAKLNQAYTPYFDGGLVPVKAEGVVHYTSTRNNNFSNRSQKGKIITVPAGALKSTAWGAVAPGVDGEPQRKTNWVGNGIALVGAGVGIVGGLVVYAVQTRRERAGAYAKPSI